MALVAIFIAACGPNVETELKNWEANLKAMDKLKTEYPAFASMIDAKLDEAKKAWAESEGISNEDEKAEKMASANRLLSGGCVGSLRNMKREISNVEKEMEALRQLRKGKSGDEKTYAEDAITDARYAVEDAEKMLKETSLSDPCNELDKVYKKLSTASSDIRDAKSKLNNVVKDTITNNSNNTNNTTNTTVEEPKQIKCGYCDSYNDAKETKCKSCGANLEK